MIVSINLFKSHWYGWEAGSLVAPTRIRYVRPSSWSVSLKNVAPDGGFACFPAVTADYSLSALLAWIFRGVDVVA
jgi:hypothetical protein